MTLAQLTSLIFFTLLPFISAGAFYIVLLPGQARAALPRYALMAAQEIEQTHQNESNAVKLEYAVTSVIKHFRAYPLFPVPNRDRIEAAIESAVFQLPPTRK